eukprot:gene3471-6102_t
MAHSRRRHDELGIDSAQEGADSQLGKRAKVEQMDNESEFLGCDREHEPSQANLRARERDVNDGAHTLESDEEDEDSKEPETKYELTEEDMHEKLDEEFKNGGYALTGFNLDEEMEEGHFDEDGTFHFKKDDDHAGDAWLEGVEIYKGPVEEESKKEEEDDDSEDIDRYGIMEEMLTLMNEHESVNAAIRRLDALSQLPRQKHNMKKNKQKAIEESEEQRETREKAAQGLTRIIELADQLMQDGVFTIYEDTYEKLVHEIKEKDVPTFEYKWTDEEDSEVYGPFTAQQMADWQEAGFFKEGVWVRQLKKGRHAKFYHSSRIDFDLYTD